MASLKKASALWNFYCSSINVLIKAFSGGVSCKYNPLQQNFCTFSKRVGRYYLCFYQNFRLSNINANISVKFYFKNEKLAVDFTPMGNNVKTETFVRT